MDYKLASPERIINSTFSYNGNGSVASLSAWHGNSSSVVTVNGTVEDELGTTVYRSYFLSFLGFVAQIPNVILNGINLFCQSGG